MNMYVYVNSYVIEVYNCHPTTLAWICEHEIIQQKSDINEVVQIIIGLL